MSFESIQKNYFDLVYAAHNKLSASDYEHAARHYWHNLKNWIRFEGNPSVLELGCGVGYFLSFCEGLSIHQLTGVDLSPQMLEKAREVSKANLVLENAKNFLEDSHQTWDIIVLMDLIEHFSIQDAASVISLLKLRLKPKGQLLIKTPNMDALFASASRYIDPTHHVGFTTNSLESLLRGEGFRQIEFRNETSTSSFVRPNPWKDRSVSFLKRLKRTIYYQYCAINIPLRVKRSEKRAARTHRKFAQIFGRNPHFYSQNIWCLAVNE